MAKKNYIASILNPDILKQGGVCTSDPKRFRLNGEFNHDGHLHRKDELVDAPTYYAYLIECSNRWLARGEKGQAELVKKMALTFAREQGLIK